jgi:hypothetical protein
VPLVGAAASAAPWTRADRRRPRCAGCRSPFGLCSNAVPIAAVVSA